MFAGLKSVSVHIGGCMLKWRGSWIQVNTVSKMPAIACIWEMWLPLLQLSAAGFRCSRCERSTIPTVNASCLRSTWPMERESCLWVTVTVGSCFWGFHSLLSALSEFNLKLSYEFWDLEFQFKLETGKGSGLAARVAKPSPQGHNPAVVFAPLGRKTKTSGSPGEEYSAREDRKCGWTTLWTGLCHLWAKAMKRNHTSRVYSCACHIARSKTLNRSW